MQSSHQLTPVRGTDEKQPLNCLQPAGYWVDRKHSTEKTNQLTAHILSSLLTSSRRCIWLQHVSAGIDSTTLFFLLMTLTQAGVNHQSGRQEKLDRDICCLLVRKASWKSEAERHKAAKESCASQKSEQPPKHPQSAPAFACPNTSRVCAPRNRLHSYKKACKRGDSTWPNPHLQGITHHIINHTRHPRTSAWKSDLRATRHSNGTVDCPESKHTGP